MQYLIDPDTQQNVASGKQVVQGIPPSRVRVPDPAEWDEDKAESKVWIVVGGSDKGGIIVRSGSDTKSPEMAKRLATGTKFEEIDREGERIKYERIDGAGPDIGWVSIAFKGSPLIKPLWFKEDVTIAEPKAKAKAAAKSTTLKEAWKVVHERVAKRSEPSKDAEMVGMEKKGAVLKGTVIVKDGTKWFKVRTQGVGKEAKGMVDAYMMIDGSSVGLGMLMEKEE